LEKRGQVTNAWTQKSFNYQKKAPFRLLSVIEKNRYRRGGGEGQRKKDITCTQDGSERGKLYNLWGDT